MRADDVRNAASVSSEVVAPKPSRTSGSSAQRHIFAIICCVRSTKLQPNTSATSVFRTLFPGLRDTITAREQRQWHVRLYLCADDNDELFRQNERHVIASAPVDTRLLFIPACANRVPSREAAEQARLDGAEYFHRTNDDIMYMSPGWITSSVRALRRLDPPNVGVAGPKVYGDGSNNKMHGGVTIDVVHRTHLKIFREYYPPQLDNWYTDSWIVYAYVDVGDRKRRVVKLTRADNFTAYHKFERRRYKPTTRQLKYLAALAECSRLSIYAFINATRLGTRPARPISCRAYEQLPAPEPVGSTCSPRQKMVGGVEMSKADMSKSAKSVEGFCRELGARPLLKR